VVSCRGPDRRAHGHAPTCGGGGWGGVSPRAVLDLPRRREAAEKPAQKVWAAPPIRRLYSGADGWVRDGAWMGRCFGVLHVWLW
jgi:hypothetical protein